MEGLVSEAMSVIEDTETDSFTRDAGLIIAARKAEHYEIATYETLSYYAKLLGEKEVSSELEATLKEGEKDRLAALVPERGGGLSPDRYEVGQAVCQAICQTARRADVAAKTGRPTPTVRDKRLRRGPPVRDTWLSDKSD